MVAGKKPPAMPARDVAAQLKGALAMHQQGQLDLAEAVYREILQKQPRQFDALQLLATIAAQRHQSDEAVALFDRALAIKPDHAASYNNRGIALRNLGRLDEALASYDKAIRLKPDYVDALNNRGIALREQKRAEAALASYDQALAIRPAHAEVLFNRGEVLLELQRPQAALHSFESALAARPRYAEALNGCGKAQQDLGWLTEALASFRRALEIRADHADTLNHCGTVLADLGRIDEALQCHERALQLAPSNARALANRGNALQAAGRMAEARQSYDQALALEPGNAELHWNSSLCRLLEGDFIRGWAEYEWRWKVQPLAGEWRDPGAPLWLGADDPRGKTVLLHAEQGLGDTIQFCRYAAPLAQRGARVILEVQPALKELMQQLEGPQRVLARGESLPTFDMHCPLLSLPLAFGAGPSNIAGAPYLRSDPRKAADWSEKLGPRIGRRIGLAWSGGATHANDRRRSIPLDAFKTLLVSGADYVCLQNDLRPADQAVLASLPDIRYVGEALRDFSDTAALIEGMDLVITVDTSVAHLAGAMGKPAWILLPFAPDWRWLLGREDSPWYGSARLFRQPAPGDWASVLEAVKARLS